MKNWKKVYHCSACEEYESYLKSKLNADPGVYMDGQEKLGGVKHDEGKPMLGLISTAFLWGIATIMTAGAKKYGEHNWRKGMAWSRPFNALMRHLTAWWGGENKDGETGKSHLWHAACELMFLVEYEEKKIGNDDRYKDKS